MAEGIDKYGLTVLANSQGEKQLLDAFRRFLRDSRLSSANGQVLVEFKAIR